MTTLPTFHLNGTSAETIEREYRALHEAIDAAADRLAFATCNARDFYPQGPGAFGQAQAERAEAFRMLRKLSDYAKLWQLHACIARHAREAS